MQCHQYIQIRMPNKLNETSNETDSQTADCETKNILPIGCLAICLCLQLEGLRK